MVGRSERRCVIRRPLRTLDTLLDIFVVALECFTSVLINRRGVGAAPKLRQSPIPTPIDTPALGAHRLALELQPVFLVREYEPRVKRCSLEQLRTALRPIAT
jgi:hypothetical protein